MKPTKTQIYEALIKPLADTIFEICEEYGINYISAFQLETICSGVEFRHSRIITSGIENPAMPELIAMSLIMNEKTSLAISVIKSVENMRKLTGHGGK